MSDYPIIKRFIHNNQCYYYDYACNYIYRVSKEQYKELGLLEKTGFDSYLELNRSDVAYLDIKKLIVGNRVNRRIVNDMEHMYSNHYVDVCNRCVSKIQLQVTRNCNFNCRYCVYTKQSEIGRKHEDTNMTWDTAKSAIDFLFDHSTDTNEIFINFYGGEPFLNFEIIKKAVEYADSIFSIKQINYTVITNGSIINNQIIDFLIKKDFIIIISFDGEEEVQNKHRKYAKTANDSFSTVYKNIQLIRNRNKYYFERNVKFNAVKFIDENTQSIYDFFKHEFDKPKEAINVINADIHGIDYFYSGINIAQNASIKGYVYDNPDRALEQFKDAYNDKRKVGDKWMYRSNCIPGAQHLLINTLGDFYPCERVPEVHDAKIGNLNNGFDFKKIHKALNIHSISNEECKKCWAIRYCKMCICHCIDPTTEKINCSTKEINCSITKSETLKMLKKITERTQNE